jgi:hypothetical protein
LWCPDGFLQLESRLQVALVLATIDMQRTYRGHRARVIAVARRRAAVIVQVTQTSWCDVA